MNAFNNLDNRDRFRVVMDKMIAFDPYHVTTDGTGSMDKVTFNKTCAQIKFFRRGSWETVFVS